MTQTHSAISDANVQAELARRKALARGLPRQKPASNVWGRWITGRDMPELSLCWEIRHLPGEDVTLHIVHRGEYEPVTWHSSPIAAVEALEDYVGRLMGRLS